MASTRDTPLPPPPTTTTTTVIHWDSETPRRPSEGRTKTGSPRSIARESHVMHFYANTARLANTQSAAYAKTEKSQSCLPLLTSAGPLADPAAGAVASINGAFLLGGGETSSGTP